MELDEPQRAGVLVRETLDFTLAQDWSTVLASAGITHELRPVDGAFRIMVDFADLDAAASSLDAFDNEAREEREERAARVADQPDAPGAHSGCGRHCCWLRSTLVAGPWEAAEPSRWFSVGNASAEAILRGQWWRTVTALTLHADLLHLTGNVVAALIFISAVGRSLGPGLGALAILLAAASANLLTALVHRAGHLSVGASTATFAALGILAGVGAWRRWRSLPLRRRAWLPIGAGLGLFAMLGVGEHSDVFAHLFGLGVGCVLGIVAARALPRRPGGVIQGVLVSGRWR